MLKGLADAVPGLREVLDDPAALEEQASKTAELFQSLQDPEKAQEVLSQLTGGDGEALGKLQEALGSLGGDGEGMPDFAELQRKMMEMMGGAGGNEALLQALGGMGGGDAGEEESGDDLKARVREQLAAMMNQRGGGEAGALDDEEF